MLAKVSKWQHHYATQRKIRSTKSNPAFSNTNADTTNDCELSLNLFHLQYLSQYHTQYDKKCNTVSLLGHGIEQNQITEYYRESLEEYTGRSSVVEIGDLNYVGVCQCSRPGQCPFKPGKEGRIVQSPLRCFLI